MLKTHAHPSSPVVPPADPEPVVPGPSADSLSRRQALQLAGFAGASLAVAGTAAGSYRLFDTAALHPGGGKAYDAWENWRTGPGPIGAVGAAILAANPHNTQPWTFHVTSRAIDVAVDDSRNIGSVDPYRREQHVGVGCALENLALGCRARGLAPTVTLMPEGAAPGHVAHLDLAATRPEQNVLYSAIGRRHTNRGPYQDRPLSRGILADLAAGVGDSTISLHWIQDKEPRDALSLLLVDAANALIADEEQSRDGFAWFRPDNDAIQRDRDGLTLDAQGLSPLLLSAAKLLPASSRAAGDAFWVKQTRSAQTSTAAAYGVLTAVDPEDRRTQLEVGRVLQRIHLTATHLEIALQHMNQITERIDRERVLGQAPTFGPRFEKLLPPGAKPVVTFRVGYPTRVARPSPRRGLAAVMT